MFRTTKTHLQHLKAFTLVELMVVVLILGALAFVAVPRIGESSTTAKINACNANVIILNKQSDLCYVQTDAYPQNYNKLSNNETYFPDGPPLCPFGTTYSMDGGTKHINPHSH
jgi:prepilin-type N-terminal cleavage/methylation domain-containing protein